MADNMLHSPGIKITETDKSFVPARPLIAGAAIIGPTPIGPAYAPTVVTSYGDYQRRFGTTFMMNRYADDVAAAAEEARKEAQETLDNQFVLIQDPETGAESFITYTEALTRVKNGEELNVCTVYNPVEEDPNS